MRHCFEARIGRDKNWSGCHVPEIGEPPGQGKGGCPDVIRKALREHVVVISPRILMLAVITVQTVLKDARMREQANVIQK